MGQKLLEMMEEINRRRGARLKTLNEAETGCELR